KPRAPRWPAARKAIASFDFPPTGPRRGCIAGLARTQTEAALCPRVAIGSANGAMGRGVSSTVSDTGAGPRGNRRWLLRGALGAGTALAVGIPARRLLTPAAAAQ